MRTFFGKVDPGSEYLIIKVRRRGRDHFNAFHACELKGACLDILGRDDSGESRDPNAHALAVEAWRERI
jgi:hypothetical protein